MANLTGKGLVAFAESKLGMPYFYGAKISDGVLTEAKMATMHKLYPSMVTTSYMAKARNKGQVGKVNVDCSGLISGYTNKILGSSQLYSQASKRIPIANVSDMPNGTVLWKSGHVGIKVSATECIEAKGINYGVVKTKISATKWTYGLLFSWITYDTTSTNTSSNSTQQTLTKVSNPYTEPTRTLRKGMTGNDVKWLQFELLEAGINTVKVGVVTKALTIDGSFGGITYAALKVFQTSSKIDVDGVCGSQTRKALKAN